ncbi:hypothetical protein, partial [Solemya velum gill symbiont]
NGTHVQSLWHSLLKNDGQMKMNGLGLIDQTFLKCSFDDLDLSTFDAVAVLNINRNFRHPLSPYPL